MLQSGNASDIIRFCNASISHSTRVLVSVETDYTLSIPSRRSRTRVDTKAVIQ